MENLFLSQFNLKFQSYLTKNNIEDEHSLKVFLIEAKGNVTVGLSKVLTSTGSFDAIKSLLVPDVIIDNISELKTFLKHGKLTSTCVICSRETKISNTYCSSSCNAISMSRNKDVVKRKSISLKKNWESKTTEERDKIILSRKNGFIEKYGVDHNWKIEGAHKRIIETFNRKYGVDNPQQIEEVKNRTLATNNLRYGGNCPLNDKKVLEKSKRTLMKKWGVDSVMKSPELLKKILDSGKETYLRKHGVENPWDNEIFRNEHLDKFYSSISNSFKYKDYIFESGRSEKVQGYEPICVDYLLNTYDEEDIVIGFKIKEHTGYFSYVDVDSKKRTYIPDIFVKSENLVIEVKSVWTFSRNVENVMKKAKAVIDKNYNFLFSIIHDKQIKFLTYEQCESNNNFESYFKESN